MLCNQAQTTLITGRWSLKQENAGKIPWWAGALRNIEATFTISHNYTPSFEIYSGDPLSNVQLSFGTREEAIAYCEKHGYQYTVEKVIEKQPRTKSYGANFSW